jgi:hypothetical protein
MSDLDLVVNSKWSAHLPDFEWDVFVEILKRSRGGLFQVQWQQKCKAKVDFQLFPSEIK